MASLVSLCIDHARNAWTKCRDALSDPELSQQLKSVAVGGAVAYSVLELYYYIQHKRDLERSIPRTYCEPSDVEYQNWMHDEFLDGICHEPDEAKYTLESIFGHVPANQLSRVNVLQALRSHILLGHNTASLKDHIRLRALVAQLEQTLAKNHNIQFQHGYNPELRKRIRVFGGIEIRPWYKPLFVYWAVRFYRTLVTSYLRLLGFSLIHKPNGISFLVKLGSDRSQPPIVFCHGLGVGVVPYFMWVRKLAQDRTVILPEMPNLSFGRYVDKYPTATEIACSIREVLNEMGFENRQIDIMGHSYGTALMTYFIRTFPHLCRRRVYVDPVCFVAGAARVSQLPQAEFTQAVYVSPSHTLKHPIQFILKAIVYWFVSRDLQVQKVVLRNVWATEMFERGDQMTEDAMVLLAENDDMVPAPVIHRYLRRRWGKLVHILYHTGTHVSFLQRPKLWDSILEFIDYGKSGRDGKNIESEHARMHNNGELPNSALEAHHWNALHPQPKLSVVDTPSSATSFSISSSSASDADSPAYLASPPPVPHSRSMQFTITPLHEAEQHSAPAAVESNGADDADIPLKKPSPAAEKTVYQFYGAGSTVVSH